MLQHFQWKPEENDGMDQGIDAVTPENLREKQTKSSVKSKTLDLSLIPNKHFIV